MKGEIYLIRAGEEFTAFELPEPGKPVLLVDLDLEVHCITVASPERPAKPEKPEKAEKEPRPNKPGKVPGRKPGRPPKNKPPEETGEIVEPDPEPVPDEQPPIPTYPGGSPLPGIGDDAAELEDEELI